MKTNYHTHTTRCMHAVGDDEDYVRSAIKGGFQELGFSDHGPWKYHTDFVSIPHGEKQDKIKASTCKIQCYKNLIFN